MFVGGKNKKTNQNWDLFLHFKTGRYADIFVSNTSKLKEAIYIFLQLSNQH